MVPALPELAERGGFSDSVAALIFAAFPVGQLVTALATAGLIDRAGRRPAMIAAVVMLAVATLAFSVAAEPVLLAGARLLQGVAAGLVWTAGLAAITDVTPADQLGFRIGIAETAGGGLGLLGPVIGGAMIDAFGTDATFTLAAALPVAAVVPVLMMPETRRGGEPPPPLPTAIRRLVRVPRARVAVAALATVAAVLALVEPLLPLDLDARLGLSSLAIGVVFAVGLAAYFALVPMAGRWSDRRGRRTPIIAGGVLMAAGLPVMAVGPAPVVAAGFAVVGAGMACMAAPSGPLMVEAVDEAGMAGSYGLSSAMLTVVFSLGYVLGPLLGAVAGATVAFPVTMVAAAVLVACSAAWAARAL